MPPPSQNPKVQVLKKIAKSAIARIGRQHWRLHRHELLILMYHRVLPPDYPALDTVQPGMWTHPETLRRQIEVLKSLYDVTSLDEWVAANVRGDALPARACAITFDDGWHDNYEHAFPILKQAGVPATIFLTTGLIGTNYHYFPERLTRLLLELTARNDLPGEPWLQELVREHTAGDPPARGQGLAEWLDRTIIAAKHYSELDLRQRITAAEERLGLPEAFDPPDLLSWEQVGEMSRSGLVRFGAHTRTHLRLDEPYEQDLLQAEIVQCKQDVLDHTGQTDALFCYPNGDSNPHTAALVKEHYPAALTTVRGWNHGKSDLQQLKRIGISEGNGSGGDFLCRLSGWV